MHVVIPSYNRPLIKVHTTWKALREAGIAAMVAVRPAQVQGYAWAGENMVVLPDAVNTIRDTRDFILFDLPTRPRYVCMMDDDLLFYTRRTDDRTKFQPATAEDVRRMVHEIEQKLKQFPHVSVAPREGANRVTSEVMYNTRVMRVLAYDTEFLRRHHITFSPAEFMGDFHVALRILKTGSAYVVLNNYVNNQRGGSGAPGGCSGMRTDAAQRAEAEKLAALHPGFVKTVEKTTKTAWGGTTRTDVIVQWKKAYEYGLNTR